MLEQRLRVLSRLSWLADLPPSQLAPLAAVVRERLVPRGELLAEPARPPRHVHIVVEGKVEAKAFPSPAIGLVEVVARDGEGLSAVAKTDCHVFDIPADELYHLLQTSPPLLVAVVRGLTEATLEVIPPGSPPKIANRCEQCVDLLVDGPLELGLETSEVRVRRGTDLWHEGEPSGFGVVILAGTIMTRERGLARVGRARRGASLGIRETLVGLPRWHDAVAISDTLLLRVEMSSMLDVLMDQIDLAGDLARSIATGLLAAHRRMRLLAQRGQI